MTTLAIFNLAFASASVIEHMSTMRWVQGDMGTKFVNACRARTCGIRDGDRKSVV